MTDLYAMITAFEPAHALVNLLGSVGPYDTPNDIDLADRYEHPLQQQADRLMDEAVTRGVSEREIIWHLAEFLAAQILDKQPDPVGFAEEMKALMVADYEKEHQSDGQR